jgi:hypothetical protein
LARLYQPPAFLPFSIAKSRPAVQVGQQRTYDPTWAFRFDDRLYSDELKEARCRAAKILKNNQGKLRSTDKGLEDIDDVLDFLEDIGFYVHGDQISPEVAHHHFFHWIRGYYLAARDYIEAWQEQESASWMHIKELFETTRQIETRGKGRTTLTAEQISEFLDSEIRAVTDNEPFSEHETNKVKSEPDPLLPSGTAACGICPIGVLLFSGSHGLTGCRNCRHQVEPATASLRAAQGGTSADPAAKLLTQPSQMAAPAEVAERYGPETTVPDRQERLVCSRCGSRRRRPALRESHGTDMVVTGTERR